MKHYISGYETLMSGKWHLGLTSRTSPHARGFERSFSMLGGCHNHYGWEPDFTDRSAIPKLAALMGRMYNRDGVFFGPDKLEKDFYSTDSFTENLLDYLQDREERNTETGAEQRPFFAYLPFTAPHWPLQAPSANINKYRGVYNEGWDTLRLKRVAKLKAMGLVPEHAVPAPVISKGEDGLDTQNWDELNVDEKHEYARKMEVYAGMVDRIDENVGRVITYLKQTSQYDDTIIMFLSDNGAEGAQYEYAPLTSGGDMKTYCKKWHNNSVENMGRYDSFVWYGARWASASTAPGLLYKMFTSEGGIRVPFLARYPPLFAPNKIDDQFTTVMDVLPTLLDICGIAHPGTTYQGRPVAPVTGASWLPYLRGDRAEIHAKDHVTGWELFGRRAVRQGPWKGLFIPKPYGPERWQLFNILEDPGETNDLGDAMPKKLQAMIALYDDYCKVNGVINQSGASRSGWSDAER